MRESISHVSYNLLSEIPFICHIFARRNIKIILTMAATMFEAGQVVHRESKEFNLEIFHSGDEFYSVRMKYYFSQQLQVDQVVFFSASFALADGELIGDILTLTPLPGNPQSETYGE